MKKKTWLAYVLIGVFVTASLSYVFLSGKVDLSRSLGASASFPTVVDEDTIIGAAKKMINEHINDYSDGEVIITVKELIQKKYLTGFEVNPATNKVYNENIRIIINIQGGLINDAYMKNNLFKNVFTCDYICYLTDNNYISFNNDTYRILKIDQEGSIYVYNSSAKEVDSKRVDVALKNYNNGLDKAIVDNVISLSINDIENSSIIDINKNVLVNTDSGYKLYNYATEQVENLPNGKVELIPVIKLKNDITYEQGDGSKFNPYTISK